MSIQNIQITGTKSPKFPLLIALLLVLCCAPPSNGVEISKFQKRRRGCASHSPLVCVLTGTDGNDVSGTVTFTPTFTFVPRPNGKKGFHKCMVRVFATVKGLTPGKHGFHIHAYGDQRSGDGTSTGGHFTNPKGDDDVPHGFPSSTPRHWGDLGNIDANVDGDASFVLLDRVIRIPAIVGRSITIHAGEDKGPTFQPTGDSGSRVATCVIGIANPDI